MIIKLYARVNISRYIKKKHGQDMLRVARKIEDLTNKPTKIQLNINFTKISKREDIIRTSANVNVALKYGTQKLKMKIACAIMETEMQNKHDQKRKIKKQIQDFKFQLKSSLTLILYNTLLHRINVAVKSRVKAIMTGHFDKLSNLGNKRSK